MGSLMTAKLVDDITDTRSNKTREAIGQTMTNVKTAGAWTRLSTFLAGAFLMVLVAFGTFDWHSVAPVTLKRMPVGEVVVMVVTVGVVVATDNLATGSITAMVIFARRVARVRLARQDRRDHQVEQAQRAYAREALRQPLNERSASGSAKRRGPIGQRAAGAQKRLQGAKRLGKDAVPAPGAASLPIDDARRDQDAEMMTQRRLRHVELFGEIAETGLAAG